MAKEEVLPAGRVRGEGRRRTKGSFRTLTRLVLALPTVSSTNSFTRARRMIDDREDMNVLHVLHQDTATSTILSAHNVLGPV